MSQAPLFQQESNVKNTNEVFYIIHYLVLRLQHLIYILHGQHMSAWTRHISSAQNHLLLATGFGQGRSRGQIQICV